MFKPTNKIEAIKLLRSLPVIVESKTGDFGYGQTVVQTVKIDLSLKDAKDLVEAIMELQPAILQSDYESLKNKYDELKSSFAQLDDKYYHLTSKVRNLLTDSGEPSF